MRHLSRLGLALFAVGLVIQFLTLLIVFLGVKSGLVPPFTSTDSYNEGSLIGVAINVVGAFFLIVGWKVQTGSFREVLSLRAFSRPPSQSRMEFWGRAVLGLVIGGVMLWSVSPLIFVYATPFIRREQLSSAIFCLRLVGSLLLVDSASKVVGESKMMAIGPKPRDAPPSSSTA